MQKNTWKDKEEKRRTEQNRSDQPIKSFGNFNDQTEVEHSRLVPGIRRTDHILDQSGKSHCGTPFQCPSCAGNDSDCLYPFPEMSGPAFCDTFTVREFRLDPCQIDTAEMEQIKVPDYMEIVFPCPVETSPPFHRRGQHRGFGISCREQGITSLREKRKLFGKRTFTGSVLSYIHPQSGN